jgi:hypothetical protein
MWRWLRRRSGPPVLEAEVLRGAPLRARIKTYSSANGHVYQYVYRGWRPLPPTGSNVRAGREYVFQLNPTVGTGNRATVQLLDGEIGDCQKRIGRELLDAERYAVAKLSLFAAFDDAEDPSVLSDPVVPGAERMHQWLETLGRL